MLYSVKLEHMCMLRTADIIMKNSETGCRKFIELTQTSVKHMCNVQNT